MRTKSCSNAVFVRSNLVENILNLFLRTKNCSSAVFMRSNLVENILYLFMRMKKHSIAVFVRSNLVEKCNVHEGKKSFKCEICEVKFL